MSSKAVQTDAHRLTVAPMRFGLITGMTAMYVTGWDMFAGHVVLQTVIVALMFGVPHLVLPIYQARTTAHMAVMYKSGYEAAASMYTKAYRQMWATGRGPRAVWPDDE